MNSAVPTDTQWIAIDAALAEQRVFDAIRLYREATGVGLAAARAALQARGTGASPAPAPAPASGDEPPPVVARFLESGLARRGEAWAWWRLPSAEHCVLVRHARGTAADFELSVFPDASGSWAHDANGFTLGMAELETAARDATPLRNVAWPAAGDTLARVRERLAREIAAPSRTPQPGYLSHSRTAVFRLAAAPFEARWLRLPARLHASEWARVLAAIRAQPAASEQWEEAGDCVAREDDWVTLQAGASPSLWAACASECSRDGYVIEASDSYFRDLASVRSPGAGSPEPPAIAVLLFRKAVDLEDEDPGRLPPWLRALRSSRLPGLVSPGELRRVAAERAPLEAWLASRADRGDTREILELMCEAARQGDWVVGLEPT